MKAQHTRPRPLLALAWLAGLNCRAPLIATGPLLPVIMHDLGIGATLGGSLTALPLLVMALMSVPAGLCADRFGPRPILALAMTAVAAAGAARAAAGGTVAILAASVALGAAIGLAQPALAQLAQRAFPARATAATAVYANGLIVGGLSASVLSAPVLLPLSGALAWRGVFLLWALPAVAAAIGWMLARLPAAGGGGGAEDAASAGGAGVGGAEGIAGATRHGRTSEGRAGGGSDLALGAPARWGTGTAAGTRAAALPGAAAGTGSGVATGRGRLGRILAIPGLGPVTVAFAAQCVIFYGLVTWLPAFYVARGWSLAAASGPIVAISAASVLGSILAPTLGSRSRGVRRPIVACSLLSFAATAALLPLPGLGVVWGALVGGATSIIFTLGLAAPAEIAPADQVGTAAGLVLTIGYVSAVLGPLAVGALRDATGGFAMGIGFLALTAVAMSVAALAVPAGQGRAPEADGSLPQRA